MVDYINQTDGFLGIGGKDYGPGEKIAISAEVAKQDPTVDWLIRSKFITREGEESNRQLPTFIPTAGEGGVMEMTTTAAQPNAPVKASEK